MQKGVIVFSSQNGSTQKAAEKIKIGMEKEGYTIDLQSINQWGRIPIDEYDFIGIGSPTYMFRPSYAILDFLDSLSGLGGKRTFTFTTYGSEIGDGADWLRAKLREKGSINIGHFSCSGRHLFPGYTNKGYIFSPDGPNDEELSAAESFGRSIAICLRMNTILPQEEDPSTHIVSRFERFVTGRFFIRFVYSRFFTVSNTACDSCDGVCVEACPTRNIRRQKDGQPVWGRRCILCCNCQIQCPQRVIKTPISWFIFAPFLSYNVWRTKTKGIVFERTK